MRLIGLSALLSIIIGANGWCGSEQPDDSYLWLEEISSPTALGWVKKQNEITLDKLERLPYYKGYLKTALALVNDKERIPYAAFRGGYFYNFWQDDTYVRGRWRRATPQEYAKKKPRWETLLDLDSLSAVEKENWVYKNVYCLAPEYRRCMIALSRGGKDAAVHREFDVESKTFVK
ncbi:MAG TPA: hypothetical protein PLL10_04375, partial [Elusimicrobiales bacterium]|nr:hypothetical protein [Elusimicrobiales bacterium]